MANSLKGEVDLIAGDRTYVLRFSIDAICALEERLGKGFPAIAAEMQDPAKLTLGMARHLLHASLREHQPDITVKEAGELIVPAGGMIAVLEKVSAAINAAFQTTTEERANKRPTIRRKNRIGSTS